GERPSAETFSPGGRSASLEVRRVEVDRRKTAVWPDNSLVGQGYPAHIGARRPATQPSVSNRSSEGAPGSKPAPFRGTRAFTPPRVPTPVSGSRGSTRRLTALRRASTIATAEAACDL